MGRMKVETLLEQLGIYYKGRYSKESFIHSVYTLWDFMFSGIPADEFAYDALADGLELADYKSHLYRKDLIRVYQVFFVAFKTELMVLRDPESTETGLANILAYYDELGEQRPEWIITLNHRLELLES